MNNINTTKIIKALEENKDTLKAIKDHVNYIPDTSKKLNDAIFSILNCIQLIKENENIKDVKKNEN